MNLCLDQTALDALYPARLEMSVDGVIAACGPSLCKHIGQHLVGGDLLDHFAFERPPIRDLEKLHACKRPVILKSIERPGVRLRGILYRSGDQTHFLVGHLPSSNTDGADKVQLMFDDFSPTDSTLDTLLVSETHQELLKDTQRFAENLQLKTRQAEAANAAKSRFLATVSHEVRTPLNGVLGMAEFIAGTQLSPEQREALDIIIASGGDLLTILNEILDLSKVESGALELEHEAFDLGALLKSTSGLFQVKAMEKKLYFVATPAQGWFMGDAGRLRQILSNLVFNAIKFTDKGGVELDVVPGPPDDDGRSVVTFEIRDSGIGMSAEVQERLFQPFSQGEVSTARRYGGTGLGLAICRHLVELMDGEISAESEEGSGSVFRFSIPLAISSDTVAPDALDPATVGSGDLSRLRVLAAEDNETNRIVLASLLKPLGIEPDFAQNGREAVDVFALNSYDLVLMDVRMPVMSGPEAVERIRTFEADNGLPPTPIFALTANLMREQVQAYSACGMDGAIGKPIVLSELRAILERVESTLSDPEPIERKASR